MRPTAAMQAGPAQQIDEVLGQHAVDPEARAVETRHGAAAAAFIHNAGQAGVDHLRRAAAVQQQSNRHGRSLS